MNIKTFMSMQVKKMLWIGVRVQLVLVIWIQQKLVGLIIMSRYFQGINLD